MIRKMLPAAVAVALLGACDSTEPRVPTALQVDQQTVSLEVGETVAVEAFVVDQHGRAFDIPPQGFAITWETANANVATVQDGEITGVGSGQTTVRARAGTLPAAEIQVTVESMMVSAQIGFSYAGHRTGTFSVNNTFRVSDISAGGSYAYTFHNMDYDDHDFIAWQRRPDGLLDYVEFYVDQPITQPGTYEVYLGIMLLGYNASTDAYEDFYLLEAQPGTINVTTATERRIVGTFALSLEEEETGQALDVTGGTFDLPILTDESFAGSGTAGAAAGSAASRALDAPRPESVRRLRGVR
jgi:hypothetical protein